LSQQSFEFELAISTAHSSKKRFNMFNFNLFISQLEQNLLTLDSQGAFDTDPIDVVLMSTREALEWYFKQLDHSVGLSFKVKSYFLAFGRPVPFFTSTYIVVC
jgi:hypothetical protein